MGFVGDGVSLLYDLTVYVGKVIDDNSEVDNVLI
jgi:hypothetical protein